jgi:uncharacterized membrane protein YebE (DUF533 family)
MFDANKVLGVLMESGMSRSGEARVQRAVGGGSPFLDSALRMLGGGSGAGSGGLASVAGALLGGGGGRRTGSGGLGDLFGSMFGGGNRTAGAGLSGGAMGLLGTLASAAMQHLGSGQEATQSGLAEDAAPYADSEVADENTRAMVMIRAMIAAAKSDGEIDPEEKQRILGRLEEAGADPDAQAFVRSEMTKPVDVNAIVSAVASPHMAIEAYAASLFAIDVDTPAEAAYMRQLAQGLKLDPALVRGLHESLEAPQPH